MNANTPPRDARVLVLAPTPRDAEVTQKILHGNAIGAIICADVAEVCAHIDEGADAAVLTQEAILADIDGLLEKTLQAQPAWSDFPLVVLTPSGIQPDDTTHALENVGNMTLVVRPVFIATLLSTVRAALRDRRRQYERRDYMVKQQETEKNLIAARNAAEAANIAKSEFLANMSHEIRTPMNAVIGLSHILAMSKPLTPKQQQFIKTLQMSADSLLSLINDLLDIAKIEARAVELELVPFSLKSVLNDVADMMAVRMREKNLYLTIDYDVIGDNLFISDPARIRQMLLNLCTNAAKFTETGGVRISVTTEDKSNDLVDVSIAVIDTGIGISPEKLDSIFDKFVQADTSINRKYGGTGLGLAITRNLAEMMGGSIELSSTVGQGARFTLKLPMKRARSLTAEALVSPAASVPLTDGARRDSVLLVEDYAPNVLVATSFLEDFGYEVDVATRGAEAFEKVKAGTDYLVVLMDVQMPGMSGLKCTQLIRAYEASAGRPNVPIIGMTAHALAGDRERCLDAGMDDYIAKPFSPDDLRAKIKDRAERRKASLGRLVE